MRRILITPEIKDLAHQYAKGMEGNVCFRKGNSPQERLGKLASDLRLPSTIIKVLKVKASKGRSAVYTTYKGSKFVDPANYVQVIYDGYVGLNSLLPSEYDDVIGNKLECIISHTKLSNIRVKIKSKNEQPFFELIVDAMRYDKVQKDIMPGYIRKIGIKTCVYCNAQFATTAYLQSIKSTKKGMFVVEGTPVVCYELDHNKPKSHFPYLCTNFYNLQPSCSSCNRRKNDRSLQFSLYYESGEKNIRPLHFVLQGEDLISFRTSNHCQDIKAYLCNNGETEPPFLADTTSIAGEFNTKLGIQDIYNEHSDMIEEILWKHKIYSHGLMTALTKQVPSLGLDGFDIKRFILGGYFEKEKDFLKRPFSVLREDIWEQLENEC